MKNTLKTDLFSNNTEIQQIIKNLKEDNNIQVVIGESGTGKTTLLRNLSELTGLKCLNLAPTHQTARNIKGACINTFFHFSSRIVERNELSVKRLPQESEEYQQINQADIIAIDEFQMLNSTQIDAIDYALRLNTGKNLPFGGKKVLFSGDPYQLLPIVGWKDKKRLRDKGIQNYLFMDARVWKENKPVIRELRQNYKYQNKHYHQFMQKVRKNIVTQADLDMINKRVATNEVLDSLNNTITICIGNDRVDQINSEQMDKLAGEETSLRAYVTGKFPYYMMPFKRDLTLKPQARVLFETNDPERRWIQGDLGTVIGIEQGGLEVLIDGRQQVTVRAETFNYKKLEFDAEKKQFVERLKGTFTQYPVRLGWATTVHGSQGMTFETVILDLQAKTFFPGITHTALSRVKDWEGLFLVRPLELHLIDCDQRIKAVF